MGTATKGVDVSHELAEESMEAADLKGLLTRVKREKRPLALTRPGGDGVIVVERKLLDELIDQLDLAKSLKQVDASMDDIKAGRTMASDEAKASTHDEVMKRMAVAAAGGAAR